MTTKHDYASYLRDLVVLLREAGAEAQRNKKREPDFVRYHEGREMAYIEVLSLMQNQADSFLIPRETIGLAGFDPVNDPLEPNPSNRGPSTGKPDKPT
jgi:hypothetical protein